MKARGSSPTHESLGGSILTTFAAEGFAFEQLRLNVEAGIVTIVGSCARNVAQQVADMVRKLPRVHCVLNGEVVSVSAGRAA